MHFQSTKTTLKHLARPERLFALLPLDWSSRERPELLLVVIGGSGLVPEERILRPKPLLHPILVPVAPLRAPVTCWPPELGTIRESKGSPEVL